jgi:hypothetical protein
MFLRFLLLLAVTPCFVSAQTRTYPAQLQGTTWREASGGDDDDPVQWVFSLRPDGTMHTQLIHFRHTLTGFEVDHSRSMSGYAYWYLIEPNTLCLNAARLGKRTGICAEARLDTDSGLLAWSGTLFVNRPYEPHYKKGSHEAEKWDDSVKKARDRQ